ncbi:DUF6266 family protein [Pedobacter sp. MC2016-14]|uniref:DUF6266 family protein n=1 Tax=Pedobacter sp. MC2016-14 TaxID=2897327 RepID=UPI001E57EE2F|nr:DUF6266 family protein [Pedobacter sp. MC2016-14]MCD0486959.1 DUF6266 family protein [Pedobacter sp. MC2016-14]
MFVSHPDHQWMEKSGAITIKANKMAILKNGIFGGFTGKVGNMVGYEAGGKFLVKSAPKKSTLPPTEKQINHRAKFKLMIGFLTIIRDFISVGFNTAKREHTAMNMAMRHNLKNAVTGLGPDFAIDYPLLMISMGNLPIASFPTAEYTGDSQLQFSWVNDQSNQHCSWLDELNIMVYNEAKNEFLIWKGEARRKDQICKLKLPEDFIGDELHCYFYFINENGMTSNSMYAGLVQLKNI